MLKMGEIHILLAIPVSCPASRSHPAPFAPSSVGDGRSVGTGSSSTWNRNVAWFKGDWHGKLCFFTIENMGKGGNLMGKYGKIHYKWRNYPIQIHYLVTNMGKIGKTRS